MRSAGVQQVCGLRLLLHHTVVCNGSLSLERTAFTAKNRTLRSYQEYLFRHLCRHKLFSMGSVSNSGDEYCSTVVLFEVISSTFVTQ